MYTQAHFRRMGTALLLLTGALMLVGCGRSSQATLTGKVTYKGQPLKGGSVSILPSDGGVLKSTIEQDGSFKITKAPVGSARVAVDTKALRPAAPKAKQGVYAKAPPEMKPNSLKGGDADRYVAIPDRYADPEKSGVTLDLKGGKNEQNIDLR